MISTVSYGLLPNVHHLDRSVEIVAIAGKDIARAQQVAVEFGIPSAYAGVDAMLRSVEMDAVVNLTPGPAHHETSLEILEAGLHLATEKPIASTVAEADALIELADRNGLVIVAAPPNMLYREQATARRLVRTGAIGRIGFARVRSSHGGPASYSWPTDPSWFYEQGSGSLLDMGVYGIHEITGILGPAKRVVAYSGITAPMRSVRGGPFAGTRIDVTAHDNTLLMLDFGDSVYAVVVATFNVQAARSPKIEVFGLEGTLALHEPFVDDGDAAGPRLEVFQTDALPGIKGWVLPTYSEEQFEPDSTRSLGRALLLKHLVECVQTGAAPVLSATHARHALEIMLAAKESARSGTAVELVTSIDA